MTHTEPVSDEDRRRWDQRYAEMPVPSVDEAVFPEFFARFADIFPTDGQALELACGRGGAAVWLARRGIDVRGFDVSPVAIAHARALADRCGVSSRCRFEVADLDHGLPRGPRVDVLVCNKFRDPRLYGPIVGRLSRGGLLAISALGVTGGSTGPFRASATEFRRAFSGLTVLAEEESDGAVWLLARRGTARWRSRRRGR